MRIIGALAVAAALLSSGASAQVTGVVTSSTAAITFKPDASGQNVVYNYSGDELAGAKGANNFGSGASFVSTSKILPGLIAFENGNVSSGEYAYVTSQTDVDVTYANDTGGLVTPQLQSQIVPAGLGVYVGSPCLAALTSCPEYGGGRDFQSFSADAAGDPLAGASIDFKILSNGVAVYDLTASVSLVRDPVTGANVFVDSIAQAQSTLTGFQLETTPGSQTEYGFNWQATNIAIGLPQLDPGASATLTYQTTVQSFSRSTCFQLGGDACLIGYSAFGDPIGGGGGIQPGLGGLGIDSIDYQAFGFELPTFNNGILDFQLLGPLTGVPEPGTWLLVLGGFGLIGGALRRRASAASEGSPRTV